MAKDLTVAQLERMLERKRTRLDSLLKRRERLQQQLNVVDGRISKIGGSRPEGARGRRVRKRPKNDQPLIIVVTEVLSRHKNGITLKDLAARVLDMGYKTFSDKFENTLYQCLYNNQKSIAHDAKTHTFRLKPAAKAKPKPKAQKITEPVPPQEA